MTNIGNNVWNYIVNLNKLFVLIHVLLVEMNVVIMKMIIASIKIYLSLLWIIHFKMGCVL